MRIKESTLCFNTLARLVGCKRCSINTRVKQTRWSLNIGLADDRLTVQTPRLNSTQRDSDISTIKSKSTVPISFVWFLSGGLFHCVMFVSAAVT